MKHKDSRKLARREEAIARRLDRSWRSKGGGPVLRKGSVRYEVSDRVQAVGCGGIGVMRQLVRNLGLAEAIDRRVGVLKRHLPYHESDHVLNLAYNILSGAPASCRRPPRRGTSCGGSRPGTRWISMRRPTRRG